MSIWLDSTLEISALILGLAGFIWLAQKKIENAIYLIVFLLPLYLLKIKIFFIPLNVLEILIGLLFLIWLLKKRYKNIDLPGFGGFALPALIVLIGSIISALLSSNLNVSSGILKSWFVAPLVLALITVVEIKGSDQIKKILACLVLSSGSASAIGIFYFLAGKVTFDGRVAAFFLSPNHLAMYLAPGFLAGLALANMAVGKKEKLFFRVITAVCALALYLTFSYGSWLAILFAGLGWIFARAKNKKKTAMICGLLFLVLLGILFFSQLNSEKLNNFLHSNRSSWQSRLMIWKAAWLIAKDHVFFGVGPGMFQEYYLKYQSFFSVPYLEWAVPQPHNLFLGFWLQTGLIGFAGFIWLLSLFFTKTYRFFKQKNHLGLILFMLMVYIVLHGLIDTTYFKNDLSAVFWMVIALGICLMSVAGQRANQTN